MREPGRKSEERVIAGTSSGMEAADESLSVGYKVSGVV